MPYPDPQLHTFPDYFFDKKLEETSSDCSLRSFMKIGGIVILCTLIWQWYPCEPYALKINNSILLTEFICWVLRIHSEFSVNVVDFYNEVSLCFVGDGQRTSSWGITRFTVHNPLPRASSEHPRWRGVAGLPPKRNLENTDLEDTIDIKGFNCVFQASAQISH
jgi:hypothetical protein